MASAEEPGLPAEPTAGQVTALLDTLGDAKVVETKEFKRFLDHIPIAIVISKSTKLRQRICYANPAFEALMGASLADYQDWSIFAGFTSEDEDVTLERAVIEGREDFLGTFRREQPQPAVVEAYAALIENEDGTENYRIAALIDVTDRQRAEREQYIRKIRDKDSLLKELQHRVRNNLQLIVALIRLEARSERRGEKINLAALAGRIESLQLLYDVLSPDASGEAIDLGRYLSQIAAAVMNTYAMDGIRLDLKVEHAPASINIALPLGLLVNELLTNAFKHAFGGRGRGVITVECLHAGHDRYRVVVADDGAGLPPDGVWPVPGKISELIVQTLRENTRAEVVVDTAPDKGVRVSITCEHKSLPKTSN
jgi:PAS domain S-box-containing protein